MSCLVVPCRHQWECEKDPLIQSITAKINNVTTVPKANYESFQILRYKLAPTPTNQPTLVLILTLSLALAFALALAVVI